MKLLTFEDGSVQLNGEELPGILADIKIGCSVRFDEQDVDKSSGKKKTPQGWEDSDISLSLYLLTDESGTAYEKLDALNGIFKGTDDKANPQIFTVANRHMQARGIRQVVFSKLDSAEDMATDDIRASLTFVEHNPPIVRQEQAVAKAASPGDIARKAAEKAVKAAQKAVEGKSGDGPQDSISVDLS